MTTVEFTFEDGDRKLHCIGCNSLTRGLLVAKFEQSPFPQRYAMCPRCRDTQAKHVAYEHRIGFELPQHIFRETKNELPFETYVPQKGVSFWDLPEEEQCGILQDPNWIADPKIDGARALLYFEHGRTYLLSSRISKRSGSYSDRSDNFPQITCPPHRFESISNLKGTVLDGEVFINKKGFVTGSGKTDSTLNETVACMNASSVTAVRLQKENNAWATFHVFDCLKSQGIDLRPLPYHFRRVKAQRAVELYACEHVKMLPCTGVRLIADEWYRSLDYEGVVCKDLNAPYYAPSVGARNKGLVKKKRMETYDGFITGFIPGKAGFKGLVGALLISAYSSVKKESTSTGMQTQDGEKTLELVKTKTDYESFEFAAVSNVPLVERKLMTASDGSLKKEYLGRVIEVRAQTKTRTGRLRHATLLRWRPDKTPQECYYEVKQ